MSSTPQFVDTAELEDAASPKDLLLAMEAALRPLLDEERTKIQEEVAYLQEVYAGITGGAAVEGTSSIFVDIFLLTALADVGFG